MTIDWTELAQRLGSIRESGNEHSGTELARTAVEQLTGEEIYISAVDHYVAGAAELLFSDLVDRDECASLFQAMAAHENESVRERYAAIVEKNPENLLP